MCTDIQVEDVSAAWKKFVADRLADHEKNRDAFVKVHGDQVSSILYGLAFKENEEKLSPSAVI